MKILKLNAENLLSIGFPIEILDNEVKFNEWLIENNVRFNYETDEIYIGFNRFREFISNELLLLKNELDSDEYNFDQMSEAYKNKFKEKLFNNTLDKQSQNEFFFKAVSEGMQQLISIKNEKIDSLIKDIFEPSILELDDELEVFDPNHFNNDCHNLFNYLVENYSKKGKVKFINIYYFLKDEVDKQKYSFNFIQDDYTIFIKAKHQIEIKKYQKAEYDFIEQKRILNSHEQQFRKQ